MKGHNEKKTQNSGENRKKFSRFHIFFLICGQKESSRESLALVNGVFELQRIPPKKVSAALLSLRKAKVRERAVGVQTIRS